MNRRSLIKCILGLAAAPKILTELDFKPPIVAGHTTNLFKDLVLTVPDYMPRLLEKYGSNSWIGLSAEQFNEGFNKAQLAYLQDKLQTNGNETKNT